MNKVENKTEAKKIKKVQSSEVKHKFSDYFFGILTGIVLLIFLVVGAYTFYINKKIEGFTEYDLSEVKELDFTFQTYDFDKYLVFGTNEKRILSEYTDEMNVYFVKGSASISFKNLDERLKPDWDLCDYDEGILRLRYFIKNQNECPFDINVKILPEDIFFVTGVKSKEVKIPLTDIELDLVNGENPENIIRRAKEEIEEEFKNDIMKGFAKENKQKLCLENDTFRVFLTSLTEMIVNNPNSKWKNVEIVFEEEVKK